MDPWMDTTSIYLYTNVLLSHKKTWSDGMVTHACDLNTWEMNKQREITGFSPDWERKEKRKNEMVQETVKLKDKM